MASYDTIAVSAYLCGSGQEKKVAYFERLDAALRLRGMRLLLVNVGPDPFESTVEHLTMPYCVTLANKISGDRYLSDTDLSSGLREAARVEAAIRNSPVLTAALKVSFFLLYMRKVLRRNKTCACVIWHQFNGLHKGLADLCAEMNVPVIYAEYGSLPGTVVFEAGGQMAESWVARRNGAFLDLPIDATDIGNAEKLLERITRDKRSRKAQSAALSIDAPIAANRAKGRKIIFYAGQNDPQTGMVPATLPNAKVHSPHYEDTEDSVRHLVELAEANDWHVFFKPHPMLEEKQKQFEVAYPDRLDFVTGADIFECMEKSDVTVTILSQVAYLASIHGHPCVLLGRNQLSGKGCVYEPSARGDVATVVGLALMSGVTAEQRDNWIRHVAQMCKYYLFAFEEDLVEMMGRDVDECAEFLESEIVHAAKLLDRVRAADPILPKTGWGRLRTLYWFLSTFDRAVRRLPPRDAQRPGRVLRQFLGGSKHGI